MKEFDIHHSMPSVEMALSNLEVYIRISKSEKVIKIIHGYGSSGKGGKIKKAFREECIELKNKKVIKDYLPGEASYLPMGFDEIIRKYKTLIERDHDFKISNEGITYLFF
ncbi:MAG: hypothetical protein AB7U79_08350 [Candidatus Izemoplasmatales bacterium]